MSEQKITDEQVDKILEKDELSSEDLETLVDWVEQQIEELDDGQVSEK
jgi:hypothetical protein